VSTHFKTVQSSKPMTAADINAMNRKAYGQPAI
jgi:hypothetical protein